MTDDQFAGRLASTWADIEALPGPLASSARVLDMGEAEWPWDMAQQAVRALIELGRVVNVVERARYDGHILVEVIPVATYEGAGGRDNREWILNGLSRLDLPHGARAVVCWYPIEAT